MADNVKRYFVKVTLEVREYDETLKRVKHDSGIMSDFGTNLTPEPAEYVRDFLTEKAAKLTEAFTEVEA